MRFVYCFICPYLVYRPKNEPHPCLVQNIPNPKQKAQFPYSLWVKKTILKAYGFLPIKFSLHPKRSKTADTLCGLVLFLLATTITKQIKHQTFAT